MHRRGRARRPQPQRVDVAAAPSGDRRVVRDGQHPLGRIPQTARGAVRAAADIFDAAAETDGIFGFEPLELPRIAEREPALRQLVLPAVADLLHEQAVLVANAVAIGRHRQRRHAVHVAGGEPAEAAVAERSVGLELAELVEIDVEAGQRRARGPEQAKIDQRVEQQAPDQEFDREVVHALAVLALGPLLRLQPAVDHAVADRKHGGKIPIVGAGVRRCRAARIGQLVEDRVTQLRCMRMKCRQREDVRRLWHVPNRNWRWGAGIGPTHAWSQQTRIHSKAQVYVKFHCRQSSLLANLNIATYHQLKRDRFVSFRRARPHRRARPTLSPYRA